VKKNWRNLQFLCLIYITGTEECGTVMPRKLKKKNGAIASVSFGAERKFTLNTETARKRYQNLSTRLLVMKDRAKLTGSTAYLPLRITTPRVNLTFEQLKYYRLLFYFKNKHNSTTSY
jgi:hypothetical protein